MLRRHPDPVRDRAADHEGHGHPSAGHVAPFGGVVDDLVHRQGDEVGDLQLDHGTAADDGGADACTGNAGLRDRRVDHAPGPELLEQARGDLEQPAQAGDVLADHEHLLVAAHLLVQRLVERLAHRQLALAHESLPGAVHSLGA